MGDDVDDAVDRAMRRERAAAYQRVLLARSRFHVGCLASLALVLAAGLAVGAVLVGAFVVGSLSDALPPPAQAPPLVQTPSGLDYEAIAREVEARAERERLKVKEKR